jgi:hypothetical protein
VEILQQARRSIRTARNSRRAGHQRSAAAGATYAFTRDDGLSDTLHVVGPTVLLVDHDRRVRSRKWNLAGLETFIDEVRRCAAFAYYWACASLFVVARSGSQHSRSCSCWPRGRCIDGVDAAQETGGSERTNAPATGSRATALLRVADQHRDHAWACGALQVLS